MRLQLTVESSAFDSKVEVRDLEIKLLFKPQSVLLFFDMKDFVPIAITCTDTDNLWQVDLPPLVSSLDQDVVMELENSSKNKGLFSLEQSLNLVRVSNSV